MPTTAPNSSVVGALSWLLPIAGVLLWVFVLPSTRTALQRRFDRRPSSEVEPSPSDPAQPKTDSTATTPRRREDDPEIRRFDHSVVVAKFPSTQRPGVPTHEPN